MEGSKQTEEAKERSCETVVRKGFFLMKVMKKTMFLQSKRRCEGHVSPLGTGRVRRRLKRRKWSIRSLLPPLGDSWKERLLSFCCMILKYPLSLCLSMSSLCLLCFIQPLFPNGTKSLSANPPSPPPPPAAATCSAFLSLLFPPCPILSSTERYLDKGPGLNLTKSELPNWAQIKLSVTEWPTSLTLTVGWHRSFYLLTV